MLRDFIAIDFETANQEPSSVCSVGAVLVRDAQVADSFYSLIQPEPNYYSYFCQRVHGLSQQDTDAKSSDYYWPPCWPSCSTQECGHLLLKMGIPMR